ncbi:protein of unknown function [Rhodovastum atsumiense]|nr:protein of unknown function [Rhodovastum atsumiense]
MPSSCVLTISPLPRTRDRPEAGSPARHTPGDHIATPASRRRFEARVNGKLPSIYVSITIYMKQSVFL